MKFFAEKATAYEGRKVNGPGLDGMMDELSSDDDDAEELA